MNLRVSKKDKLLIPFMNLHFKHGLYSTTRRVYNQIFKRLMGETSKQKNKFLHVFYSIIFAIIGISVCIVYVPLYALIYLLTVLFTFLITSVEVLVLGVIYGVLPFILKTKDDSFETKTTKKKYKGIDKLLAPISWSIDWNKNNSMFLFRQGVKPSKKLQELNQDISQTHIVDRLALLIAQVISFILYVTITFVIVELSVNIVFIIICLVFSALWILLKLVQIIASVFSNTSDEELENKEKLKEEIEDEVILKQENKKVNEDVIDVVDDNQQEGGE